MNKQYWLSIMNHPKECSCSGCEKYKVSEKDIFGFPVERKNGSMNKQEATELRETILRELPEGFTCTEVIDSTSWDKEKQELQENFWFTVRLNKWTYPSEIMSIHTPGHWELLKRFSLAYAETKEAVETEQYLALDNPDERNLEEYANSQYQDVNFSA